MADLSWIDDALSDVVKQRSGSGRVLQQQQQGQQRLPVRIRDVDITGGHAEAPATPKQQIDDMYVNFGYTKEF